MCSRIVWIRSDAGALLLTVITAPSSTELKSNHIEMEFRVKGSRRSGSNKGSRTGAWSQQRGHLAQLMSVQSVEAGDVF